jgi:TatD DNase family protein
LTFIPRFTMKLIDTHCHLYLPEFADDRAAMMERAFAEGIESFCFPAIDSAVIDDMLALEAAYPGKCHAMMGLHPCSVKENWEAELAIVADWLAKRRFVAVGEIGLDYYWDKSFAEQQLAAFHRQTEWALQYDIPIVIHSREAMDDCIAVVKTHQQGRLKGIFHCFSGTYEQARQIIDLGFYLGIGGVLTYKNAGMAPVLAQIGLEHLVLETDAPYLSPVPMRGKRNESSYIKYVLQRLAEVKECPADEVARITTANAEKIFGI